MPADSFFEKIQEAFRSTKAERFTDHPVEAPLVKGHAYQLEFNLAGQSTPVRIRIQPDLRNPQNPKAIALNPDLQDWENHPYALSIPQNEKLDLFDPNSNGPLIPIGVKFVPGRQFRIAVVRGRHANQANFRFETSSTFLLGSPTFKELGVKEILPLDKLHLDDAAFPVSIMNRAEWKKTIQLHGRLKGNPFYEEGGGPERTGIWTGRPIISRDTPINGGVYLGAGPHEALVVDDRNYPEELNRVYREVVSQMAHEDGKSVLQKVFGVVGENLGGSQGQKLIDRVEAEVDKLVAKFGLDTKVPINEFIRKKIGYCRHRAVLGAYILERLVKEGRIRGSVSVDRNEVPGLGGHAWVRWTEPSGQVYILDSAIGYVGPLDTAPAVWNYRRPGE